MMTSRCLVFAFAALLIGCEAEPRAWEMDGYVTEGKPNDIEYLYCETANTLVQVFPNELRLIVYEYGTSQIPEPNYVEHQTEVTKYSQESSRYLTSETAATALISSCGEVELLSEVYFGPGSEGRGYVGSLMFQRRFRDVKVRDTFECRASAGVIQRDLEWDAKLENSKFSEKKSSCKFMPDTKSFLAERDLFREEYSQLAAYAEQLRLERAREAAQKKMKLEKAAGVDRI